MLRALVYLLIEAVAATCFYPNGDANGDTPCYVSKKESNCCGTGYACLSNKVCRLAHEDSTGASMPYSYGRGSCTDRTWTSPSCPLFCLIGSSRIENCDKPTESKYCCAALNGTLTQDGLNGFCDCDARVGSAQPLQFEGDASAITTIGVAASLIAASTTQQSSSISSTTSTVSSVASLSQTSIASSRASATPSSSSSTEAPHPSNGSVLTSSSTANPVETIYSHHDREVAVGAGVGTSIALICLAALGFYIFHRRLRRQYGRGPKSGINLHLHTPDPNPDPGRQEPVEGPWAHELSAEQFRCELPGDVALLRYKTHEQQELGNELNTSREMAVY